MPKILVRVITPKRLKFIDLDKLDRELRGVLKSKISPMVIREFKKTIRGWKNKPLFRDRVIITANFIKVIVFPSGINRDQYIWVHDGVKARTIIPRADNVLGRLSFQTDYAASTRPGMVWSRSNTRSGPWVHPTFVNWPGIEPRHFSKEIARDPNILKEFRREVENAIRRASR